MYERIEKIKLPISTSLLCSNLCSASINKKTYLGIIHIGEFVILEGSSEESGIVVNRVKPKISPAPAILQAAWVDVGDERPLLILATVGAVQIFDWDGSVLLFTHIISPPNQNRLLGFFRGICGLRFRRICIGMHTGEILILNSPDEDGSAIFMEAKLRWLPRAITAIAASDEHVCVADASGVIAFGTDSEQGGLMKTTAVDSYDGSCVTCLEISKGSLIAGYVSGHIRIFSICNGNIQAEVCAHAKSVTSLDIALGSGMLLSTSEDTFARVWKIVPSSQICIEHKYSRSETNEALCGGKFLDETGCAFYLSSYDASHLLFYRM